MQNPVGLQRDGCQTQESAQQPGLAAGADQHREPAGVTTAHLGQVDNKPAGAGPEQAQELLTQGRGAGSVEFANKFGDGYAAHGPGGNIQAGLARNSGVHDGAPDQVEAEQGCLMAGMPGTPARRGAMGLNGVPFPLAAGQRLRPGAGQGLAGRSPRG